MGSHALPSGDVDGACAVAVVADGDRCKAHQRAIAGGVRVPASRSWVSSLCKFAECHARCAADVKTPSRCAVLAIAPPAHKTAHEVGFVEVAVFNQAVGKAERHARVVGPFPRCKVEWTAADHVGQRRIGVARSELQCCAERIADRKAKQAAAGSILADRTMAGSLARYRAPSDAADRGAAVACN